jgi:hypothetical protein
MRRPRATAPQHDLLLATAGPRSARSCSCQPPGQAQLQTACGRGHTRPESSSTSLLSGQSPHLDAVQSPPTDQFNITSGHTIRLGPLLPARSMQTNDTCSTHSANTSTSTTTLGPTQASPTPDPTTTATADHEPGPDQSTRHPPTPTLGRHPQRIPPCRLTSTDDIFGKRSGRAVVDRTQATDLGAELEPGPCGARSHRTRAR